MPIKDLLWACPACHAIEALDREGRCRRCRARFRRGRGARIVLEREGAGREERDPADWLERLPWPDLDGEGLVLPPGVAPPYQETVELRSERYRTPVRRAGDYLGTIEVFGRAVTGRLALDDLALSFETAGEAWRTPLLDLLAVQPASSTIQLRRRDQPVVSIRFREGSVRLWEQRLKHAVRRAWRDAGRGEILEFQPRIRSR